jgi:hypothetical protein
MTRVMETLRETLDEWEVSQAEVSRMTGFALTSALAAFPRLIGVVLRQ